jgi:hypothetical protein
MAPDGSTPASRKTIKSHTENIDFEIPTPLLKLAQFAPDALLCKTFVRTLDDGKSYRAIVVRKSQHHDAENHTCIKFLVELGDGALTIKWPMAFYVNVLKTLRMKISPHNIRLGALLMSLEFKVHSESPTRTQRISLYRPLVMG